VYFGRYNELSIKDKLGRNPLPEITTVRTSGLFFLV
jgi:hypothetical protein